MVTLLTCDVLLRHFRKMPFTVGIRSCIHVRYFDCKVIKEVFTLEHF